MTTRTVHMVAGGFCTVCGETEEYLRNTRDIVVVEWVGLESPPMEDE